MGIGFVYTFFMGLLFVLCIRQRDIRKQKRIKAQIKAMISADLKTKIYMVLMMLTLFLMSVILFYIFPENTIIQNIRCITLTSLLAIAAYYDWLEYRIPNKLIIIGLILWFLITVFEVLTTNNIWIRNLILEMIVSMAFLIVCILCMIIVKNGLGMGDIKLLILIGLLEGLDGAASSVFISMIVIFAVSVVLLLTKRKRKTDVLPFAPYILIGTILSICTSGY